MKLTKHAWILWGITLVVVLVLAIVIPFVKTAVYWIGLLCTVAMFGVCVLAFARAFREDSTVESKLLGWPVFKVGYVALAAQIVVGFVLMGVAALCPVWAAAIAEVAVFAVTGFCMTVKDAAREAVNMAEGKVTDNTAAWKAIRARANAIAEETGHPAIKKLAEELRYADPTPSSLDGEIAQMLETLSNHADDSNIGKTMQLVNRRNLLAKGEKSDITCGCYDDA